MHIQRVDWGAYQSESLELSWLTSMSSSKLAFDTTDAETDHLGMPSVDDFRRRISPRVFQAVLSLVGLVVCVMAPMAIYAPGELPFEGRFGTTDRTVLATAFAFFAASRCASRFIDYPGVRGAAHIVPIVAASYALVAIALLVGRFEYSRVQLLGGYVCVNAWLILTSMANLRYGRRTFLVVPPISMSALPISPALSWIEVAKPTRIDHRIDGIIADLRPGLRDEWQSYVAQATLAGVPVYDRSHIVESLTGRTPLDYLSANDLGTLLPSSDYLWLKRPLEFVATLAILPVLIPIFALIAVAIRLDQPGPIFFVQRRIGHRGQPFRMIKFRSMIVGASSGTKFTTAGDDRVTRTGRFLRRYRLDELPQVFNVLRGEMSWIGPRPEAIELHGIYRREIPLFPYRGIVRPGITGWAQINQGYAHELNAMCHKLEFDLFYIKHFSFWLDLVIAIRTLPAVLRGFGAR